MTFKEYLDYKENGLAEAWWDDMKPSEPHVDVSHGYMPPRMPHISNRFNPQQNDATPSHVDLRYGVITRALDRISMKRKVGDGPKPAEMLLKTLQSYATRPQTKHMPWQDFAKMCLNFKLDPAKVHDEIS